MASDALTELALRARAGDRVALSDFVRATQDDVWRVCAHLASPAQADDLAQEVYVRALRALPRFRAESSARTWLLAIARHTAIDAVRAAMRRRRLLARAPVPEDEADRTGDTDLTELVAALDPDRRSAFVLTQIAGCSYEEAAEICDCPVGTIRSRVARARGELVEALRRAEAT
ncbi:MAG: sigma-70 family RNA polymerase sigma factor [Acidimicrobiales bacterium]|nr:sigma-70 family RNA polymerase sigma factor [Acidimicrobiales bacterium]